MRVMLKPIPVLVACAGCAEGGQLARDVAAALDRKGFAEASWMGADPDLSRLALKTGSRWPVFALDACSKSCARQWLAENGVVPQRCYMLADMEAVEAEPLAERIAASW